jgi:elongator complex protein 1
VDLNLMVDYCWPRFLSRAEQFVAAVPDASELCDLLLALRPGSVLDKDLGVYGGLAEMLSWQQQTSATAAADGGGGGGGDVSSGLAAVAAAGNSSGSSSSSSSSSSNKVPLVCAALRAAVLAVPCRYLKGYLKTVVMTYARSAQRQAAGGMMKLSGRQLPLGMC